MMLAGSPSEVRPMAYGAQGLGGGRAQLRHPNDMSRFYSYGHNTVVSTDLYD